METLKDFPDIGFAFWLTLVLIDISASMFHLRLEIFVGLFSTSFVIIAAGYFKQTILIANKKCSCEHNKTRRKQHAKIIKAETLSKSNSKTNIKTKTSQPSMVTF